MTIYPAFIDNILTLPPVSGSSQEDVAITALRSAVFAIETELGISPRGIYPDVRTRLDILESRINYSIPSNITNDGYVLSPLYIWNYPSNLILSISDGYGVPTEDRLDGSLYMRGDGYANNELYVRRGGLWYPIQTDLWVASGDLSGDYLSQTVVGLQGRPLNVTTGMTGAVEDGYFLMWNNSDGYWEPQTGFIANGDLAPNSPYYGRTNQIVTRIQQRSISSEAPSDGYSLIWEATDNHWEPQALAMVWSGSSAAGDGYITRTNIRSNRLNRSPSTNNAGRVGMVNLGTSTLNMGGASADYVSILGGDNNTASGAFAAVLGGALNTASDGYALVLDGYNNVAAGIRSSIVNGQNNTVTINAIESFIVDGHDNAVSLFNSFVLNGSNNSVASPYAGIFNGQDNAISAGNTYAWIGFGNSNTITGSATYSLILGGSGNTTNAPNVFIGNATNVIAQSGYDTIINGINNTIGTSSTYSTIIGGNTNAISNSSGFSFIGAGNNITATGLYSTVLNANTAVANGLHSLVLNGNNNSVTGSFSTVANGNDNTISGGISYSTILDGYLNSITNIGGFIADGYNNIVNGLWSSIINGNNNTINARNSTILNGSSNTMDGTSAENTILVGTGNSHVNSSNTTVTGSNNTLTNASFGFVIGTQNNIQSTNSFTNGSSNTQLAGAAFNRVWGSFNTIGAGSSINAIFGNSNSLAPVSATSNNFVVGSTNVVDGYGNSIVLGHDNIVNASHSSVVGQYGKSRLFGQQVHANGRFTAGKIGEAQSSRLVLTGNGGPGASFLLQLQDTVPTNMTFVDGYSYELNIRVMVISTAPTVPFAVVTTRYVFNVLMHQEGGILVIDNINRELETQNGSTWTVSVSGWGLAVPVDNQFQIQVDNEQTPYIQGTPSTRRAIATVDMREISRL